MIPDGARNAFQGVAEKCRTVYTRIYWGWVVCISFLVLFTISAGVAFSFGELFVPISQEIHESYSVLSWAGALPGSLPMLIAPVATWLHYRFSARALAVFGTAITSVSLLGTAASNQVAVMLVVHGILSGFGLMCVVNPPFYLLEQYFPYTHKHHVLATSIIACGFPLATLIFNPVIYELLNAYGWRSAYGVLALLMICIGLPAAATFRTRRPDDIDTSPESLDSESAGHHQLAPSMDNSHSLNQGQTDPAAALADSSDSALVGTACNGEVGGEAKTGLATSSDDNESKQPAQRYPTHTKILLTTLWFIVSTLKSVGYYVPIITLVKQMDVLKIPQWKASRAMILIGSCELISRGVTSLFGDRFKGNILHVYVVCTGVLSLQNILGSFAESFNQLLIFSAAFGLFAGPIIAAMYSSCSEVMKGQHVPELFGLFRTGLGLGALIGPTIAGAIYDATESFKGVYYFNAVTYALTAALYTVIIVLNWRRPAFLYSLPADTLSSASNHVTSYGTEQTTITSSVPFSLTETNDKRLAMYDQQTQPIKSASFSNRTFLESDEENGEIEHLGNGGYQMLKQDD